MGLGVALGQQELVRNEADGLQDRAMSLIPAPTQVLAHGWSWGVVRALSAGLRGQASSFCMWMSGCPFLPTLFFEKTFSLLNYFGPFVEMI